MSDVVTPFFGTNLAEPVKTSKFDVKLMKSLFAELETASKTAAKLQSAKFVKQDGQTAKQFREMKQYAEDLCRLKVFITSNEGDQFWSYDSSIFDDPRIPSSIKLIVFDSSPDHMVKLNQRPNNWIRLELDLAKPVLLDFTISPSAPTMNGSNFLIVSDDGSWSKATHTGLQRILAQARTGLGFLHGRNVYDFYFLALGFPLCFLLLLRINAVVDSFLARLPNTFFSYSVLIFIFILLSNLFRLFFNYTRWVFPYIQLDWGKKRIAQIAWLVVFAPVAGLTIQQAWAAIARFLIPN